MEDKKQIDNIKKNLENPVFTNLDVLLDKSRVKLISFSLLGFFIYHYDIDIKTGLSFLGITIKNITINDITIMLTAILIYLFINFIWMSWNRFIEWNIRRTGTSEKVIKNTKSFAEHSYEYPNDTKQASLYYYWVKNEKNILELESKLKATNFNENEGKDLNKNLQQLKSILYDERIKASLEKFDETFCQKIKSENLRWVIFDFGLPGLVCLSSIILLLIKIKEGI